MKLLARLHCILVGYHRDAIAEPVPGDFVRAPITKKVAGRRMVEVVGWMDTDIPRYKLHTCRACGARAVKSYFESHIPADMWEMAESERHLRADRDRRREILERSRR